MTILSVRRSNRIDIMNHRRSPRIAASVNSSNCMNFASSPPSHYFTLIQTNQRPRSKAKFTSKKKTPAFNDQTIFKNLRSRKVVIKGEGVLSSSEKKQSSMPPVSTSICRASRMSGRSSCILRRSPRVRNGMFVVRSDVRRSPRLALGA